MRSETSSTIRRSPSVRLVLRNSINGTLTPAFGAGEVIAGSAMLRTWIPSPGGEECPAAVDAPAIPIVAGLLNAGQYVPERSLKRFRKLHLARARSQYEPVDGRVRRLSDERHQQVIVARVLASGGENAVVVATRAGPRRHQFLQLHA